MRSSRGESTHPTPDGGASTGEDPRALAVFVLWRSRSSLDPLLELLGLVCRSGWWADAAESSASAERGDELDADPASTDARDDDGFERRKMK